MNQNLELIRQKCIEANPEIETRTMQYQSLHIKDSAIRLADVLLAIGANVWKPYQGKAISVLELMIQHWNLRKDDLNQQSEDTINFLAGLLG